MKKLKANITSGVAKEIAAVLYGMILPYFILDAFGSDVNGLLNSIRQFLQMIAFLDLGVGAVVQASLYKPLYEKDDAKLSQIVASAYRYFRRIAQILAIYVAVLVVVYPLVINTQFGFVNVAVLVVALSLNSFSQSYFGIVNQLLLKADQKGYIYNWITIVLYTLCTLVGVALIKLGASVQVVELVICLMFTARPLYLMYYVNHHYHIDRHVKLIGEPIAQKWNGMAQHICAVVIDATDIVVLTLFSTLTNVSIYSVYNMVLTGIKSVVSALTTGVTPALGELFAKGDDNAIKSFFKRLEWSIHTLTVVLYGCTAALILPFVQVYTRQLPDTAIYQTAAFALLITLASSFRGFRLPYNMAILAAGHFKQTQHNYVVATAMNLIISVIAVFRFGLIGVAIGTLAALAYQCVWMANYVSNHLIAVRKRDILKQALADAITALIGWTATHFLPLTAVSYGGWIVLAVETTAIWLIVAFAVNMVMYRQSTMALVGKLRRMVIRK